MIGVLAFCIGTISALLWWYSESVKQIKKRKERRIDANRKDRNYRPRRSIKPKSPWLSRAAKDMKRLPGFNRLNGLTRNVETTQRMIEYVAMRHPEKDQQWCIEKAIYDLERDRMAR